MFLIVNDWIFSLLYSFQGVGDESFRIFIRTERLCVKLTQILVIKYVVGYIVLSVSLAIINVTYCYFKDNGIDPKCLYTPYKHILVAHSMQLLFAITHKKKTIKHVFGHFKSASG